ncbi:MULTISPECIES: DUF2789 family protein [Pseudomonas]|uniref:DUF2789 domain-containing protein n=1 Tax=Pseudomonas quercus TaxID=2722792 RepID=A0ABX0YHF0_9PSED|nr:MULTISPECIES: DUF2789 family protein [Pseudomonas]MBF7143446.1 DUF2789 family protein [Pseudomonas sp. LY10J]NJP01749.1 DUF2789 domain-containing protein [Pseudomonas quercus]
MEDVHHSLESLFAQLGLETDGDKIDQFIDTHQLAADVKVSEAEFWSDAQASFLKDAIMEDGEQAPWVDELNTRLHHDANQQAS